jgi:cell division protein FtsZ
MEHALRTHVIGVGCGAGRAMNQLCTTHLTGVTYTAVNTDRAALQVCRAPSKILLDLGGGDAGGSSELGCGAAMVAYEQLAAAVKGADVVVIIACLGGGTGGGAAPLLAEIAKAHGCLTVAVVTLPSRSEDKRRRVEAEKGHWQLQQRVDTLLTIPLQRFLGFEGQKTTLRAPLHCGDEVVHHTVHSVVQASTCADARALLARMGQAGVGTGVARGEHRGTKAAWRAVTSPTLEPAALERAQTVLLSVTGGPDLTMREAYEAEDVVSSMTRANVFMRASWEIADHPQGELWVTALVPEA